MKHLASFSTCRKNFINAANLFHRSYKKLSNIEISQTKRKLQVRLKAHIVQKRL
jgi:hypothetical protein